MGGGYSSLATRQIANAHVGIPKHFEGTAGNGVIKVLAPDNGVKIMSVLVKNTDTTNTLGVCFDGSDIFFPLDTTDRSISYSGNIYNVRIKGVGGTATYSAIINREPNSK